MAEATASAAVCVATGSVVTAFCAAFGFDPMLMAGGALGGFLGFVIVRSLLPSGENISMARVAWLSVGSVLLSTIMTLLVSPWTIRTFALADVPPGAVRLAVGAAIGAFAPTIAALIRKRVMGILDPATKESGNA